jgi:hypothetical protein
MKMKLSEIYHNKKEFVKITSLHHLRCLANDVTNPEASKLYTKLAQTAASNLGMPNKDLATSIRSLLDTASETSEAGVVDEINFVRDCVKR